VKILVAGGAGYIGSVLVPKLLDRGYEVDVADLFWFGNHLPKEVGIVGEDIFSLSESHLEPYEQVIFLAGLSNDPMAEFSPSQNFIYNAAAPAFLGYIAKRAGVKRCIYGGTCSVYGYTVDVLCEETAPASSTFPYGISKLQGEQALLQLADRNFSVICFRQGTVCGYSPRMRLDLVVNQMFKSAVLSKLITVNNPAIWRPILSIEDAATAYIRAIEAGEQLSGVFNIASGNYTVGELGDLVKNGIEHGLGINVRIDIRHLQDFRSYKVSIEKAKNVLSYKPNHDVWWIVRNLIENMDKFKDFDNTLYYNIETFKRLQKGVAATP
jgi:nucleoside-diphosphate-sugar epimerase